MGECQHCHLTLASSLQAGAGSSEERYCTASQGQDHSGGREARTWVLGTRGLPAWRGGASACFEECCALNETAQCLLPSLGVQALC